MSEDIGIASPNLPSVVCPLLDRLDALRAKKNKTAENVVEIEKLIIQATKLLVDSPKSRIVDLSAKVGYDCGFFFTLLLMAIFL